MICEVFITAYNYCFVPHFFCVQSVSGYPLTNCWLVELDTLLHILPYTQNLHEAVQGHQVVLKWFHLVSILKI